MEEIQSLDAEYFRKVYAANDDPWNFQTSEYEAAKYAATLAALPKQHYESALEIGCSIGVLTQLLAKRCTQLLATDISQKALDAAIARCSNLHNISFQCLRFPEELPAEKFDLIMVSEVAYYLSPADWKSAMNSLYAKMQPGANMVLVHWLPEVPDYPQTGDAVHDSFAGNMQGKMTHVFNARAENYRIDVWGKSGTE